MAEVDRRGALTGFAGLVGVAVLTSCGRSVESESFETSATSARSTNRARIVLDAQGLPTQLRAAVSRDAEKAASIVTSLWGDQSPWPSAGAHLRAFADHDAFVAAGGDRNARSVTATTIEDGTVLISPSLLESPSAARVFVLSHEFTHVRLGVRSAAARWVAEGAAELTAWHASGLSFAQYAPTFVRRVRAGDRPYGPPSDAQLDSDAADLQRAYQHACAYNDFLLTRTDPVGYRRFVVSAVAGGRPFDDLFDATFAATQRALGASFAEHLATLASGRR